MAFAFRSGLKAIESRKLALDFADSRFYFIGSRGYVSLNMSSMGRLIVPSFAIAPQLSSSS